MSDLEEKLRILKKKKLTAKIIVEQQRTELRLLKSSSSVDQRFEELRQRFQSIDGLDHDLMKKFDTRTNEDRLRQTIDDLSNLLDQIQTMLGLKPKIDLHHSSMEIEVKKQKELLKLIQWKLSDLYAHRLAEEVSCITS